ATISRVTRVFAADPNLWLTYECGWKRCALGRSRASLAMDCVRMRHYGGRPTFPSPPTLITLSETLPGSRSRPRGQSAETPSVSPVLPLLLLEPMRDRDRPEEVLEDEDVSLSFPRRLRRSEAV